MGIVFEAPEPVLAIISMELNRLLSHIFQPEFEIEILPFGLGHQSVWGVQSVDNDHFRGEIYTTMSDDWAYCPRYPKEPQVSSASFNFRLDGDGVWVVDVISGRNTPHTFEDPRFFEQVLDHIFYNVDFLLREVQVRFEWVISQQGVDPDFDEYGDVSGRLAVLKEKRKLFGERYRSVEI